MVKTLQDVQEDMSRLYDQVNNAHIDLKTAGELTNITGKFLRAYELDMVRQIFVDRPPERPKLIGYRGAN